MTWLFKSHVIFFITKNIKMISCKLRNNISIGSSGVDTCNSTEMNAGVSDGLYIFNLEDVKGLVFENDSRPDDSLFVETIITSAPFYTVDASQVSFEENYEDNYYSQELTCTIASVSERLEEILQEAVHGKYLVAFNVIGDEHYRLLGWKEGLSLDDVLNISTDNNAFTLTFSGNTTYPMLEVDKTNFKLEDKVYEPSFEPLFQAGEVICSDGWAVAKYTVKVNAAGQALDDDNKLVQYSGKRQDAYKLQGADDGNYNIIGTYASTDYIDGKSVRVYDTSICEVSGSISVSPSTITLCSTVTSQTVTVLSSNEWELVTYPSFVDISRVGGGINDQVVTIYSSESGGKENLLFRNRITKQTASLEVNNDRISGINLAYTYPNGTESITLTPTAYKTYQVSSTLGTAVINDDGSFTISGIPTSNNQQTFTVTLSMGSCESIQIEMIILGTDTSRRARAIAQWCEVE